MHRSKTSSQRPQSLLKLRICTLCKASTQTVNVQSTQATKSTLVCFYCSNKDTDTHKATLVSHPSSLKIFGFWRCSRLTGFLTDLGLQLGRQQFLLNTVLPGRQHVPTLRISDARWRPEDVRFKNIEATVAQGCLLQSEILSYYKRIRQSVNFF